MGKRKVLLNALTVAVAVTVVAGCSSNNGNNANAPEGGNTGNNKTNTEATTEGNTTTEAPKSELYELGKEPLDLTFYGNYNWYTMPQWGKDAASKWIQENKKINITAIHSGGNAPQKLQTMIAGNDLPDIIWTDRGADFDRLYEAGLLVSLDEYIEKYPNFKKWADPKMINMLRSADGKIYGMPNYYTNQPNGNAGYIVNRKIYKALGEPKLETTDDLYAYLKQVKEKYPDVVPFETGLAKEGNGIDQLFSAFKEDNFSFTRYWAVPVGDKFESIYKDEGFRESMVYSAKLMREGLMTQDAMTQTEDQIKEKILSGRVAVYASVDPMKLAMQADQELSAKDPNDGYFFIMPIYKQGLDPAKIYPGTYNMLGWNMAAITTSADNPEAIFAMLDWMTGPEGSSVQMWGPPGPDGYWDGFKEDSETPNFTARYGDDPKELIDIQAVSGDMIWVGNTVFLDSKKSEFEATLPEEKRNWSTNWQYKITWKTQGDATQFVNLNPSPDSPEGIVAQSVKDIWLTARAQALFAKSDAEVLAILDKAHDDSVAVGFPQYLEAITAKWHSNQEKMAGN
ncbi:ABC-type glycerol-3-phosphate transport system substrate-binding protein [Paenibacillus phyllosphaerae]|uniref:ABC-type glycerol-3-phosphate transport system substrate-binding protein n=1 Tax=Paenibacillus phyllosphaerae TaxID=274593 RepID=A0A7W5FND0_9BACL|nr:ABC-type glycerol-3-phosphate transport system substrate-binding protein [Paenibacillus phyllosphaerae]